MKVPDGLIAVLLCVGMELGTAVSVAAGHSWYLIQPQIRSYKNSYYTVGTDDPINKWVTTKVFDTAAECTNELKKEYHTAEFGLRSKRDEFTAQPMRSVIEAAANGQCVASDDPRLLPTNTRWQVMYPPTDPHSHEPLAAPLSAWYSFPNMYDAPSQCEMAKRIGRDNLQREGATAADLLTFDSAQCVATDDPRLRAR